MTKLIPILSGRCLVVELPEGALLPEIDDGNLYYYVHKHDVAMTIPLPPGNWRIIGMLNEVREKTLSTVLDSTELNEGRRLYNIHGEPYPNRLTDSGLESLESAILAGGWYFENPVKIHTWASENADDYRKQWEEGKKRVLDRSRCLLLGREI